MVASQFSGEYLGQSIGMGLMWVVMTNLAFWLHLYVIKPEYVIQNLLITAGHWTTILGVNTYIEPDYADTSVRNKWSDYAWDSWKYGNEVMWGLTTIAWCFSYIPTKDFQDIYRMVMLFMQPVSWILHLWTTIAFIIAGVQEGATPWKQIVYAISTDVGLLAIQTFAWLCWEYGAKEYYNYEKEAWIWNLRKSNEDRYTEINIPNDWFSNDSF